MSSTPSYSELNSADMSSSNSNSNAPPGSAGGGAGAAASAGNAGGLLKVQATLDAARDLEFRTMADFVTQSLFQDLMSSESVRQSVVEAASTKVAPLYISSGDIARPPTGLPTPEIFFAEMKDQKPFIVRLVCALQSLGYRSTSKALASSVLSTESRSGVSSMAPSAHPSPREAVSDAVLRLQSPEDEAKVTDMIDEAQQLRVANSFALLKTDMRSALIELKISKKGTHYDALDSVIRARTGQAVRVRDLLANVGPATLRVLERKVERLHIAQRQQERDSARAAMPSDLVEEIEHHKSMEDAAAAAAEASSSAAAKRIQNLARGKAARAQTEKTKDLQLEEGANRALLENGFLEMMADVLHDTMFNLMQEASYDEFPITAEPLRFMLKRD